MKQKNNSSQAQQPDIALEDQGLFEVYRDLMKQERQQKTTRALIFFSVFAVVLALKLIQPKFLDHNANFILDILLPLMVGAITYNMVFLWTAKN